MPAHAGLNGNRGRLCVTRKCRRQTAFQKSSKQARQDEDLTHRLKTYHTCLRGKTTPVSGTVVVRPAYEGESEGVAGTVFSCVAAWFVGERFPYPVHCDAVCGAKGGLVDLEVGFGHGV